MFVCLFVCMHACLFVCMYVGYNDAVFGHQATPSARTASQAAPSQATPLIPGPGKQQFPCQWASCSEVFNGPVELYTHVCGPGPSHLAKEGMYVCVCACLCVCMCVQ